ncbi:MAG: 1-(5-phosphoribosyl)-5-[(5-phosphoribosylamino)methylideneamino]imidazole-4-carboxamide isomerase [Ruminococcaceae bacterium]|nr:1-(5-phosphoribosyl)-5-[(5-phosphoribosylamino)methylideneamino]imidazole-4-carboxamide isomerase [Oscillospiraceae bacterium]
MLLFPAIDLFDGKAVRLLKGDYSKMTVYSETPLEIALDFEKSGAKCLHLVDLQGAKTGDTPNLETVRKLIEGTSLFTEIGGGIRNMATVDTYISLGADRVILGTAAVKDEAFLKEALSKHGEKIAVGVDIKNGEVAVSGWTETGGIDAFKFCKKLENLGVKTVICTDISKDGAMQGTNHSLYKELKARFSFNTIASGGVSSLDDVKKLREQNIYGAIIGKAYYTGAIDLKEALEVAK